MLHLDAILVACRKEKKSQLQFQTTVEYFTWTIPLLLITFGSSVSAISEPFLLFILHRKRFRFFFATKRFESIIFFQIWTTFSCVKVAIIQSDVVVLIKLLPSNLKSRKFYHQSQKCHWLVCCGVKIHASDVLTPVRFFHSVYTKDYNP